MQRKSGPERRTLNHGRFAAVVLTLLLALPPAGARPPIDEDARLGQKVTVEGFGRPLKALLGEISRASGVRLSTSLDYEDRWICLRVRDRPLRDVMRALADLYQDEWKSTETVPPRYILSAALPRRRLQARLLEARRAVLKEELLNSVASRRRGEYRSGVADDPPEAQERRARDFQGRGEVLSQLPAEWVDRLLQGDSLTVNSGVAEGGLGAALRRFVEDRSADGAQKPPRPASVFFESRHYQWNGTPLQDLGFTVTGPDLGKAGFNVAVNPTRYREALARKVAELFPPPTGPADRSRQKLEALTRSWTAPGPGAPRPAVLTYPEQIKAAAEYLNVDVAADSHLRAPVAAVSLEGLSPVQAVDRVAQAIGAEWTVRGPFLSFRHRDWWLEDTLDPPAAKTEAWLTVQKERGHLSLAEMASLGKLTDVQIANAAQILPNAPAARSPWFRFWAALSDQQRSRMLSPSGLPAGLIPLSLRENLLNRLEGGGAHAPLADALRRGVLKAAEVRREKQVVLFELQGPTGPGQVPTSPRGVRFQVTLPQWSPTWRPPIFSF